MANEVIRGLAKHERSKDSFTTGNAGFASWHPGVESANRIANIGCMAKRASSFVSLFNYFDNQCSINVLSVLINSLVSGIKSFAAS